jgi:hypothetical protein
MGISDGRGGQPMDRVKKLFLIGVGIITIAFDEASKAVEQALETIQEQREKINGFYQEQA